MRITLARPSELMRAAGISLARPLTGQLEASLAVAGTLAAPAAKGLVQARDLVAFGTPVIDDFAHLHWKDGRTVLEGFEARGPASP
jgi:hypothetical protein